MVGRRLGVNYELRITNDLLVRGIWNFGWGGDSEGGGCI
jgi:hypothetical protein